MQGRGIMTQCSAGDEVKIPRDKMDIQVDTDETCRPKLGVDDQTRRTYKASIKCLQVGVQKNV